MTLAKATAEVRLKNRYDLFVAVKTSKIVSCLAAVFSGSGQELSSVFINSNTHGKTR